MSSVLQDTAKPLHHAIDRHSSTPPMTIPPGHVGEFTIPGTGRRVWWTGRVAIGLLHQETTQFEGTTLSSRWIQSLLIGESKFSNA